jgi:hypothetical protein
MTDNTCTLCGQDGHRANHCQKGRQCVECTHVKLTRNGCGRCSVSTRSGWFPSPTFRRLCGRFDQAGHAEVAHRRAQLAAIGGRA